MPPPRTSMQPLLWTPYRLRGITARNRIVLSPMVQYRARDGVPGDFHLVHLGQFALGGFGLVMTEATAVEAKGRITHHCTGLWNDEQVAAWRRITSFLREHHCLPGIQLVHSGRKGAVSTVFEGARPYAADAAWPLIAPTATPFAEGHQIPEALDVEEIAAMVDLFVKAAKRADSAGFEVLELHGAHGYLLASFLSPVSNRRSDAYGGDLAGRMRFPLEVCQAVRAAWPDHKPLFFRLSALDGAGSWGLDDTVALARELKRCGVDVVDCSSGGIAGSVMDASLQRRPGFQVPFAAAVRRQADIASMAVGLILDGPQAEDILVAGDADLIAIGRQALDDPHWPLHAAARLGCDPNFALWPQEYGYWLNKRQQSLVQASDAPNT